MLRRLTEVDPVAAGIILAARTHIQKPQVIASKEVLLKKVVQTYADRFGHWTDWPDDEWSTINRLAEAVDLWYDLEIYDPATTTGHNAAWQIAQRLGWFQETA